MIKFGQLNVIGFCSIEQVSYNLSQPGTTLVRGRNGVGKTTLISSISWILYGKTPKDISDVLTKEAVRPKGYQGVMGEIFFEKDGELHQVIRCLKYKGEVNGSKGGDRLIYLIDGIEIPEKKKPDIQRIIEKNLGMSLLLFNNSIMFGQGVKRLVQESGSDKKKIFEEVFELEYLTTATLIAKKYRDEFQDRVYDLTSKANAAKREVDTLLESYHDLKKQEKAFKSDIDEEVQELKNKKNKLKREVKLLVNKLKPDGEQKEVADMVTSIEKKMSKLRVSFNENKAKVDKVLTSSGLEELINSIIYAIDNKPKRAKKKLIELKESIELVNSFQSEKDTLQGKLNKANRALTEDSNLLERIDYFKDRIKSLDENMVKVASRKQEVISPKYLNKAKSIKATLKERQAELDKHTEQLNNFNWVIQDPLGNKGIKNFLFESSLTFLNNALSSYSELLGFKIEFGVDLSSTKKDFYTLIEINGSFMDYDELSGGQKQLVNIAMAFAMQASTTASKGINIMLLDEVFESLSQDNIEIVIELIKKVAQNKSLFIILHHESLPLSNAKVLEVDMKDGLSTFKF